MVARVPHIAGGRAARAASGCVTGSGTEAAELLRPLLTRLTVDGGFVHAGPTGAGRYVKLVHNGVLFSVLEAIADGVGLLEAHRDKVSVPERPRMLVKGGRHPLMAGAPDG